MQYRPLGRSGIEVSALCLGTMTFGEQNTAAEAFAQIDRAVAAGVNFIDTAEMYPVPPRAETAGATETIIGDWLVTRGGREELIIATKVAGPGESFSYLRGQPPRLDRANLEAALHASLRRLRTDYVDLYQLHWPDRETNFFGKLGYTPPAEDHSVPLDETLGVLADLVAAGKVRQVGLSNETPWGVMHALHAADCWLAGHSAHGGPPRVVSIQNPYNLLNRSFEIGLAEVAIREQCGLLAYSPLAFGMLSGKYEGGARPADARLTRFSRFDRYSNPQARAACSAYVDIARRHGLDPARMALAFVTSRPFVTSTIIGATTLEQLDSNLASIDLTLSAEVLAELEAVHTGQPNPAP